MYQIKINDRPMLTIPRPSLVVPLLRLLCTINPTKDFGDFPVYVIETGERVLELTGEPFAHDHLDYAHAMLILAAYMGEDVYIYDDGDDVRLYATKETLNDYLVDYHECRLDDDGQYVHTEDGSFVSEHDLPPVYTLGIIC